MITGSIDAPCLTLSVNDGANLCIYLVFYTMLSTRVLIEIHGHRDERSSEIITQKRVEGFK